MRPGRAVTTATNRGSGCGRWRGSTPAGGCPSSSTSRNFADRWALTRSRASSLGSGPLFHGRGHEGGSISAVCSVRYRAITSIDACVENSRSRREQRPLLRGAISGNQDLECPYLAEILSDVPEGAACHSHANGQALRARVCVGIIELGDRVAWDVCVQPPPLQCLALASCIKRARRGLDCNCCPASVAKPAI